ncbi:dephospho-CoA kinase [Methylophilaceae bacterium]|nr:dephospho-CoA kinase [Methylophilaceae bacterium]
MFVIGLTGGIGSGKSEAASIFAELGVPVVDVDVIAHQLTAKDQPTLQAIIEAFGHDFLQADSSLNRAALRERVFSDPAARQQLESILHPAIYEQAMRQLHENAGAPYQILAIPLLFESPRYRNVIQKSLVIDCDESLQISRTMARSGLSKTQVEAIMRAQIPRSKRIQLADIVIENNGSRGDLRRKIEEFHKNYI